MDYAYLGNMQLDKDNRSTSQIRKYCAYNFRMMAAKGISRRTAYTTHVDSGSLLLKDTVSHNAWQQSISVLQMAVEAVTCMAVFVASIYCRCLNYPAFYGHFLLFDFENRECFKA